MAVVGDIIRGYVKPSLDGLLVLRKRTSRQTSARLERRKGQLRELKGKPEAPGAKAHKICEEKGLTITKRVYKPGVGYEEKAVCPIKEFKSILSETMPEAPKKGA